jgi:NAD/NADP transhydrogenase alpha subunit
MNMNEQITKRTRKRLVSKGNEGTITKTVKRGNNAPVEKVERFVAADTLDPAYVTIGARFTKNLGNYESIQISASVTLPCEPNEKSVKEMKAKASEMVEAFINEELKSVEASL